MVSNLDLVHSLTDLSTPAHERRELATTFSHAFGWRPNDFIDAESGLTTASLVVEHGLDSAAVLSFFARRRGPTPVTWGRKAEVAWNLIQLFGGLARLD